MSEYHPSVAHIMKFFEYKHLPQPMGKVSKVFCVLAKHLADELPDNPEKTVALRRLLEAKDAAVRTLVAER